jgi:hypothetical protein
VLKFIDDMMRRINQSTETNNNNDPLLECGKGRYSCGLGKNIDGLVESKEGFDGVSDY